MTQTTCTLNGNAGLAVGRLYNETMTASETKKWGCAGNFFRGFFCRFNFPNAWVGEGNVNSIFSVRLLVNQSFVSVTTNSHHFKHFFFPLYTSSVNLKSTLCCDSLMFIMSTVFIWNISYDYLDCQIKSYIKGWIEDTNSERNKFELLWEQLSVAINWTCSNFSEAKSGKVFAFLLISQS